MAGIRKKSWKTKKGINTCWEITYYVNGEQVRKSGFKTKLEAQMAMPTLIKSFSKNLTIKELLNLYINEHCPCNCKETTIELYKGYIRSFQNICNLQAKRLTGREINKLIILWKSQDFTNKTINNLLGFLQASYNYAIENNLLSQCPVTKKHKQSRKQKKTQYLTDEEIIKFKLFIKSYPFSKRLALLLALNTGVRIGELLALEWSDVDFKKKLLNINKQYYKRKLTTPKTLESIREIDLDDSILNELLNYKNSLKIINRLIFSGENGGYWDRGKFIKNYFKRAMEFIGQDSYTFHCLRHTHATILLSNGVDLKYVQERLGHTTPQTTLEIYSHVMPKTKNKICEIFQRFEEYEQNMSNVVMY